MLTLAGLNGLVLRDFNLKGRAGEIVGVVGLLGSGLEELVAILAACRTQRPGGWRSSATRSRSARLAVLAKRGCAS